MIYKVFNFAAPFLPTVVQNSDSLLKFVNSQFAAVTVAGVLLLCQTLGKIMSVQLHTVCHSVPYFCDPVAEVHGKSLSRDTKT